MGDYANVFNRVKLKKNDIFKTFNETLFLLPTFDGSWYIHNRCALYFASAHWTGVQARCARVTTHQVAARQKDCVARRAQAHGALVERSRTRCCGCGCQ